MKKFKVVWSETYVCEKTVEAEDEEEAVDMVYGDDTPDRKIFEGYSDWSALPVDGKDGESEED